MTEQGPDRQQVDQFIQEQIESVPHLEALLLLWNTRPRQWSLEQVAAALYISCDEAGPILRQLSESGFLDRESEMFAYNDAPDRSELIGDVDRMYRRELVRISKMIHARPAASLRAFAKAFQFKKD